jgi:thiamine monophosphate synthase
MPPAVVVLGLVALGVPAGVRAAFGRPRSLGRAWLLAAALALAAQALGELAGVSFGVLGDAQLALAVVAAGIAAAAVAVAEGPAKG